MNKTYKYSVVTSIFNDHEIVHEVENPVDEVEYILVTDNSELKSNTWKIKLFDKNDKIESTKLNWLYVKFFPFDFCSTDICLYLDGSFTIKNDFSELIEYFIKNNCEYAAAPELPYRSINHMIDCWHGSGIYDNAENAKKYLEENNYKPNEWGIISSALIFRRNTYFTQQIDELTWKILKEFGGGPDGFRLNQDGFTAALKKLAYHDPRLMLLDQHLFFSNWFEWNWHKGNNGRSWSFHVHGEVPKYLDRNKKTAFQNKIYDLVSYKTVVKNNPLLTVVITCYNKENTIKRAIDSVKNMSYLNYECIIVNNGSTDNSLDVILKCTENDKRFTVISQENKNVCNSRNIGSFAGNGKYLVHLDGDDEIGKTFCEDSIAAMENDKNICISTGLFKRVYLNNRSEVFCTDVADFNHYTEKDRMISELYINKFPVTSVLRMNRFKSIGGFKEGTEYTQEDWEMFIRYFRYDLTKLNVYFVHDEFVVIMYEQQDSKTVTQNLNWHSLQNQRLEMYNENPKIYEEFFSAEEIEKIKNCINF